MIEKQIWDCYNENESRIIHSHHTDKPQTSYASVSVAASQLLSEAVWWVNSIHPPSEICNSAYMQAWRTNYRFHLVAMNNSGKF